MRKYIKPLLSIMGLALATNGYAATCADYYTEKFAKIQQEVEKKRSEERDFVNTLFSVSVGGGFIAGGIIGASTAGAAAGGISSLAGGFEGAKVGTLVGTGLATVTMTERHDSIFPVDRYQKVLQDKLDLAALFQQVEKGDSLVLRTLHRKLYDRYAIQVPFQEMMVALTDINLSCGQGQNLDIAWVGDIDQKLLNALKSRGFIE